MSELKRKVWLDKHSYDEAEKIYYENLAKKNDASDGDKCVLSQSKKSVAVVPNKQNTNETFEEVIKQTENTIKNLVKEFQEVKDLVMAFNDRLQSVESFISKQPKLNASPPTTAQQPSTSQDKNDDDADDGVDLFGSDSEEDDEAKKIKEQRLAAYAEKKSKKPVLVAKSNIILDVKPWDDETNMKEVEELVRSIIMDGLLWGASKLVPLAYGIKKLQISCVVEDDKVSIDLLQEKIEDFSNHVQSVDIAAFNKI